MNFYIQTLGCKVNAVESDSMAALLLQNGYTQVSRPEEADVLLLNSCTVTASGDKRMLHALQKLRKASPDGVLVLTGCYVQAFPEEAATLQADILTGTRERAKLPALLEQYFRNPQRVSAIGDFIAGEQFEELPQGTDAGHTRAFLKIQDGCNRFCSYCIIPYARGRCRSRPLSSVQAEAAALRRQGYREIVLCGINLACWEMENSMTLAEPVEACTAAGFERVRLGSLEPDGLTEALLERLAGIPALCPQFHISVQSGCDRTLQAMRRRYTTKDYADLLTVLRSYFPGAAVTTDLMTGFPGETEDDFAETLRFVQEMQFAQIHIFRYSPRPGTPAAGFSGQVPEAVKKERADRLKQLAQNMQTAFLQGCIGQTFPVLFERERGQGFHAGHAPNYAAVLVPVQEQDGDWRNTVRPVQILRTENGKLFGTVLR